MWTKSSKEITVNEQIVFQFTRIFSKLCFSSHVFSANCVSLLLSIKVLRTVQGQFLRLVTFETLITILTILNLNSWQSLFLTTMSTDSGFWISMTHGKKKNGGTWSMTFSSSSTTTPFFGTFPLQFKKTTKRPCWNVASALLTAFTSASSLTFLVSSTGVINLALNYFSFFSIQK